MKNTWIMTWYTLREALARKVFISFLIISSVVILLMAVIFSLTQPDALITNAAPENTEVMMKDIVISLELMSITPFAALCLLLSIFSCSSFVPLMLEKGNIDLLISKPVSRTQLLLGKYFGGLLVVFINIAYLTIGVWLVVSIKFGYWDAGFLSVIFVVTFIFAVLYAMIVWFGVMTKSSTAGMMVAYFIFLFLSPILELAKNKWSILIESDVFKTIIDGLYYLIPKTSELLSDVLVRLVAGQGIENFQPIISSFLFLILMLYLSIMMFNKKDF